MNASVFGKKTEPIILSMLRKGGLDIPLMLIFDKTVGINGIALATPLADTTAGIIAIIMLIFSFKKLNKITY